MPMNLEDINKLVQSWRRHPLRTIVYVIVTIFVALIFLWAAGFLGEKGRQAATPQSYPSTQKKEPSSPKEITPGQTPVKKNAYKDTEAILIQKCNQPTTGFKIKPEFFIPRWFNLINQLRIKSTTYDLDTLISFRGRALAAYPNNEIDEAKFTLNCLEKEGYLRFIENNSGTNLNSAPHENIRFEFIDQKWDF